MSLGFIQEKRTPTTMRQPQVAQVARPVESKANGSSCFLWSCVTVFFALTTVAFAGLFGWAYSSNGAGSTEKPADRPWRCTNFPSQYMPHKVTKCNAYSLVSSPDMEKQLQTDKVAFDLELYQLVVDNQNIGGVRLASDKTVYRGANLASGPDCQLSLATQGNVDLVLILYDGSKHFWPQMNQTQNALLDALQIDRIQIENFMVDEDKYSFEDIHAKLDQILSIVKSHTSGNVFMHCYTGERDTGVAFAAVLMCMTDLSYESIIDNLKCHMGYSEEDASEYMVKTYERAKALIDSYTCKP